MSTYTTPSMDKVRKAIARSLVAAFEKEGLAGVYLCASNVAPKIYPPKIMPSADDLEKATDLAADAFLIVKDRG